jgi:PadR family transcriptional regulator AphA
MVTDATEAGVAPSSLSLTEYAVLGLLTFGPASGYELDRLAARSLVYFWRPAKSKIYVVLPRLVNEGLATIRHVSQAGRPDKQVYTISGAGGSALRRWLDEESLDPAFPRNGLLLKLFFGAQADEARLRRTLEEWRDRARAQLAALEEIRTHLDPDQEFFPYLTLLHGIEDAESTVRWATDALQRVERRAAQRKKQLSRTEPPAPAGGSVRPATSS